MKMVVLGPAGGSGRQAGSELDWIGSQADAVPLCLLKLRTDSCRSCAQESAPNFPLEPGAHVRPLEVLSNTSLQYLLDMSGNTRLLNTRLKRSLKIDGFEHTSYQYRTEYISIGSRTSNFASTGSCDSIPLHSCIEWEYPSKSCDWKSQYVLSPRRKQVRPDAA